ncbi:MAG: B12-binding domain-containing radical SAM protein [Bacteroidales bacterium]|nr:B12-binding domain-containing radical SAM protein [Bacteroidales bacterium]
MPRNNTTKYKLLLISPRQRYIGYTAHAELARMFGRKRLMIPLALPVVAANTPDHYEIRIVDEESETIPVDYRPDIVGITTLTATKDRAFQLGDHFRSQGVPVVMGGVSASVLPDQYLEHADAVVIGEAENAWEYCLEDFENGRLKQKYTADPKYDYKNPKQARWDLVNMKTIFQVAVQITRGCPFNCDFCLVPKIFGRRMRFRDIDNVIEEIRNLPSKYVFFVDDNLTINKRYAHELMNRLKPLGISWACMASIDVADDDELLKEMAEAGCFNILIGFESLNPESLGETHKDHNLGGEKFVDAIRKVHRAGIHINASFIVGFDNDALAELDRIFDFSLKTAMPNVNLHLLAAPPGSELNARLKSEGRLFNVPESIGDGFFPTIHYMNMGQLELFDCYVKTINSLFSYDTILKKAKALFSDGYFTRPGRNIPFYTKMRLILIILYEYLFTKDKEKRALFLFLTGLIRNRKIAVDKAFSFMLSMLSINRQIGKNMKNNEKYRSLIRQNDAGPWKDRKTNQSFSA